MNTQVRTLFEEALIKSLDVIRPLVSQYTEPYLIWTPTGHGWHGQDISQPDWALIALATEKAVAPR